MFENVPWLRVSQIKPMCFDTVYFRKIQKLKSDNIELEDL